MNFGKDTAVFFLHGKVYVHSSQVNLGKKVYDFFCKNLRKVKYSCVLIYSIRSLRSTFSPFLFWKKTT